MANKKDLAEAQSYSRRRLVTAFSSGIPDGVELTPKKNQSPVIVGVGLTVIAILVSLFYGMVSPSLPDGWENNKLIVAKNSAARYVSSNGTLHPVINAISARLLIPSSDFKVLTVADDQLKTIPIGSAIGILGAPDSLPEENNLIAGSINSCVSDSNITTTLSNASSQVTDTATAIVANVDGISYLVNGSHRYQLPQEATLRDAFLRAFGIPETASADATAQWINLFEQGSPIEQISVDGAGNSITVHGVEALVGSVVMQQGDAKKTKYVVRSDRSLSPLTDFTYGLYITGKTDEFTQPNVLSAADFQFFSNSTESAIPEDWPSEELSATSGNVSACAIYNLETAGRKKADTHVNLAVKQNNSAHSGTSKTNPSSNTSSTVKLKGGTGALLQASIGTSDKGYIFAVDSTGTAYPIANANKETLKRLGYAKNDVQAIPRAWIDLFSQGVELSAQAAGSAPGSNQSSASQTNDGGNASSSTADTTTDAATNATDDPETGAASADAQAQCQAGVENYINDTPWTNTLFDFETLHRQSTGKGVTVAVIDSGVDADNPHLANAVTPGVSHISGDATNGMTDIYSHGTIIAGIIAARAVDGSSVEGFAPDATILPIRIFESLHEENGKQTGGPSMEDVSKAVIEAVDHHAQIINISLSDITDLPQMRRAVDYAESHGSLIISSAGNRLTSASTKDGRRFPAAYSQVVGVTAVDTDLNITDDSVHGTQVDIATPGAYVASTVPGGVDCLYATDAASTSFATAYVSGAAALIASQYPNETPAQWRQRLLVSANRPNSDQRDNNIGWGLVDPQTALNIALSDSLRGPTSTGGMHAQNNAETSMKPLVLHKIQDPDTNFKRFVEAASIAVSCAYMVAWLVRTARKTARKNTSQSISTNEHSFN